jgi:hypothetical protein
MDARYGFRTVNMNLDKQFTKAKKSFLTLFCQVSFILSTHFEKMSHDFEGLG